MLIGIWRIDLDSLANDPEVKGAPEEEREDALPHGQKYDAEMWLSNLLRIRR